MRNPDMPHIIVAGNPVDGLEFYGPFATLGDAVEHANNDGDLDGNWWIAPLHPVED